MKELLTALFSEIGHKLTLLLLVGTTAVTTGSAVIKLSTKPAKTEASESSTTKLEATSEGQVAGESTREEIVYIDVTPTPTRTPTPTITPSTSPRNTSPVISTNTDIGVRLNSGESHDDELDDGSEEENKEREDTENEDRYLKIEEQHEADN